MKVSKNRFEQSDTKIRKRHEVMLTTDSPDSVSGEMELSPCDVIHTVPSEKALANKAQGQTKGATTQAVPTPVNPVIEDETQVTFEDSTVEEKEQDSNETIVAQEQVEDTDTEETQEKTASETKADTVDAAPKKKKRFRLSLTEKKALSGWLFVLPFVIGILFVYAPIVFDSIQISLSDYTLLPGRMELEWNSFANYKYLFAEDGDPYFSITIWDGIKDLLLQIPAIVIFSLFMAIILNQKMTGRAVFRAIFFLPVILSTGVIDRINSEDAFANTVGNGSSAGVDNNTGEEASGIISALDIERLLGNIKLGASLVTYVTDLVNNIFDIVSRSGVQMLIFLSGLQSISPSIYESCQVEGASSWETFWKITLPMISPMILVNAVYTVIDLFTCYDNNVMIYFEKIYRTNYPLAGAMSWVYVGIVLVFLLIVALILKSVVFYQRRD